MMKSILKTLIILSLILQIHFAFSVRIINPETGEVYSEVYDDEIESDNLFYNPEKHQFTQTDVVYSTIAAACVGILATFAVAKCTDKKIAEVQGQLTEIRKAIEEFKEKDCNGYIRTFAECLPSQNYHIGHNHLEIQYPATCLHTYSDTITGHYEGFRNSPRDTINMCVYLQDGNKNQDYVGQAFLNFRNKRCSGRPLVWPEMRNRRSNTCGFYVGKVYWKYTCGWWDIHIRTNF